MPMHLIDVTLFYGRETGGVQTYLSAKRRWIRQRTQIRHTLVVPTSSGERREDSIVGIQSVGLPFASAYRIPVGNLERVLRRLQPSLIEVGDPYHLAWTALRVGEKLNIPVVGFYHSDLPKVMEKRLGPWARRIAENYVAHLYSRFDLAFAPSQGTAHTLRRLGVEKVCLQPLGVDVGVFHPSRRDPNLRDRLGLPANTRLLIYAGRLAPEKNLPLLTAAVRRLGDPYHLLVIGSGAHLPNADNMTWLPFEKNHERLAGFIASCDAFVHPGDQETFGLAVLEAMACGIPVVGMATGGVAELVDSATGILVPPNNAAELAEGIASLYDGAGESLQCLGANGRDKVERHYSWDRVIKQLVGRYELLCGSTRASFVTPPQRHIRL